jgi:tellurite resistance protein
LSQTEADWILKAMIVMAAADARLDAREVRAIRTIYQEQAGREIDAGAVVLAVQTYARRRTLIEDLSIAANAMRDETKETILRAAFLTAEANGQLSPQEFERLAAIAAALGISDDDMQEIVADSGGEESSG